MQLNERGRPYVTDPGLKRRGGRLQERALHDVGSRLVSDHSDLICSDLITIWIPDSAMSSSVFDLDHRKSLISPSLLNRRPRELKAGLECLLLQHRVRDTRHRQYRPRQNTPVQGGALETAEQRRAGQSVDSDLREQAGRERLHDRRRGLLRTEPDNDQAAQMADPGVRRLNRSRTVPRWVQDCSVIDGH